MCKTRNGINYKQSDGGTDVTIVGGEISFGCAKRRNTLATTYLRASSCASTATRTFIHNARSVVACRAPQCERIAGNSCCTAVTVFTTFGFHFRCFGLDLNQFGRWLPRSAEHMAFLVTFLDRHAFRKALALTDFRYYYFGFDHLLRSATSSRTVNLRVAVRNYRCFRLSLNILEHWWHTFWQYMTTVVEEGICVIDIR